MAKRNVNISKPVSATPAKPAAKPAVAAKPVAVTAAPSAAKLPTVDLIPAGVNRTAATIAKQATNFGGVLSERDNAYFAFWAGFAKANGGTVTIADVARAHKADGSRPAYNGSAKPHDAGVAVRLAKAGILSIRDNGHRLVFTDAAKSHALYTGSAARKLS